MTLKQKRSFVEKQMIGTVAGHMKELDYEKIGGVFLYFDLDAMKQQTKDDTTKINLLTTNISLEVMIAMLQQGIDMAKQQLAKTPQPKPMVH